MSKVWVDRIDAIARRRIGRTAQVAALPPQPERLNDNLWHLNRRPWVHARVPGLMSRDVGAIEPVKAALMESTRLQDVITNNFTEYNLDELLVSPVLPAEIYDALQFNVATYDPTTPDGAMLAQYEPAGYNLDSQLLIPTETTAPDGPSLTTFQGPPLVAPCIVKEISWYPGDWQWSSPNPVAFRVSLYVEGFGALFTMSDSAELPMQSRGQTMKGLDRWIIAGAMVPKYEIEVTAGTTGLRVYNSPYINITAEPLIRKR